MVGWFEIPVKDLQRAKDFYESVFDVSLHQMEMGPLSMAIFPMKQEPGKASGALVKHEEFYKPSVSEGVLVYFSCEDVADFLKKVDSAGGKILVEKKMISEENGFMGLFRDPEGNRVALHSNK